MAYQGPRRMRARYAGLCAHCGERFAAGELIVWFPNIKATTHVADYCQTPINCKALAVQADPREVS